MCSFLKPVWACFVFVVLAFAVFGIGVKGNPIYTNYLSVVTHGRNPLRVAQTKLFARPVQGVSTLFKLGTSSPN